MRSLWRFVLFLLVLFSLALVALPFTESGTRVALRTVSDFTPLQIDYSSGTLGGELRVSRLALTTAGVSLVVDDLVAEMVPACLWRSALCFRRLSAAVLNIDLLAEESQAAVQPLVSAQRATLMEFPVRLESNALSIGATRIRWQDGEWRNGPAELGLVVSGSTIAVSRALLSQPVLSLREPAAPQVSPGDTIELPRIDLPLELLVDHLQLEQPAWDIYGAVGQLGQLALRGLWRNTTLQLDRLDADSEQWGELSLGGELTFEDSWPLVLESTVNLTVERVWTGLAQRQYKLAAQGGLDALDVLMTSAGTPDVSIEMQVDVLDRQLPFQASLQSVWQEDLLLGDFPGVPPQLAQLRLESPLSASLQGSRSAQQFELRGAATGLGYQSMALAVAGSHRDNRISVTELNLRDAALRNELHGRGEIDFSESLSVSMVLDSEGIELPRLSDYARGRLAGHLNLNAALTGEDWRFSVSEVDLAGTINDLPATIEGYAGMGRDLSFEHSDLRAQFNGALVLARFDRDQRSGEFEIQVDDIGRWLPEGRGSLLLQGQLAAATGLLQTSGSVQQFQWQNLRFEQGAVTGQYGGDAGQSFDLDVALTNVSMAGLQLDSLQLLANGVPEKHQLVLHGAGDVKGELRLAAAQGNDGWQALLAPTSLTTRQGSWQLADAVNIGWVSSSGQLSVKAHCWRQKGTQICPGDLQWGEQGRGSLAIDGQLDFLDALLPPGLALTGAVDLQLEGNWSPAAGLVIRGHSRTDSVLLTQQLEAERDASVGWDKGEMDIRYDAQGLHLLWSVERDGLSVLNADVSLPAQRDGPLKGVLSFERLQLGALAPFVPQLSTLDGEVSGQLRMYGTIDSPLAEGVLELTDGSAALMGNPTPLEQVALRLDVSGERATLGGSGLLGGGKLTLQGAINLAPEWQMELNLSGQNHAILYPPSASLEISQDLVVTATGGGLNIKGEVVVHEGMLEPEELPPGSVAISADVVEVDYAGNALSEGLPFAVGMDVKVTVENNFKVTGALIEATLGGQLRLLEEPRQPLQVFGNLKVIHGEMRAYQQSLRIKRGVFSFTGRPDNPLIDVRAQRAISGSNIIAGVQVQGTFEALKLEVFSEPAMPRGEAMSYLVRGRGLDASAGEDGTALAVSVATGVVNRTAIVSELNRIPGVSNVAFGSEGSADETAATVSGYIGNRIYLSYGLGLYEPINVLTSRLYLRPRLWLEVVSRLENSIDLYYSFDIK